jgi:hypothetical protein
MGMSLKFLAPKIQKTLQRFSLSVVCSLALFTLAVADENVFDKFRAFTLFFLYGYFIFGITRLIAEARDWKSSQEAIVGLCVSIIFYVLISYLVNIGSMHSFVFLKIVLLLGVFVAPFMRFDINDDLSFWNYQQQISTGFFLASLSGLLLGGGLTIAVLSINYLFDSKISGDIFKYIWFFATLVYAPFNMLSWVPEKFTVDARDCHAAPGLPFILNWILAPLAMLYFFILYGYGAKILFEWGLPRGNVTYMVTGFGALGILTYISGWIMRDTGSTLLRYLYKHFFSMLILPVILLAVGIYVRIDQYGWTEDRYSVVMLAVWMGFVALLYTLRPSTPLKILMISLLVFLLLGSLGPWSVYSVSNASQYARLEALLVRNNMLDNGVAVPARNPLTLEDQEQLSSLIEYFSEKRAKKLAPLLRAVPATEKDPQYVRKIMAYLNVRYVSSYERKRNEKENKPKELVEEVRPYNEAHFYARNRFGVGVPVSGYDYYFPSFNIFNRKEQRAFVLGAMERGLPELSSYKISLKADGVYFFDGTKETLLITGKQLYKLPQEQKAKRTETDPVVYEIAIDKYRFKFVVESVKLKDYGEGEFEMESLGGNLFFSK